MELINQIDETILFNNDTVRIIGTYNDPWFVAKDICDILGLTNITNALKNIPEKYLFNPWEAPDQLLKDAGIILGQNYPKSVISPNDLTRSSRFSSDDYRFPVCGLGFGSSSSWNGHFDKAWSRHCSSDSCANKIQGRNSTA